MPAAVVKSFAKKTGKSVADVEKLWDKAKESAKKQRDEDDPNFFRLVVGILKKMLKIEENLVDGINNLLGSTEQDEQTE